MKIVIYAVVNYNKQMHLRQVFQQTNKIARYSQILPTFQIT